MNSRSQELAHRTVAVLVPCFIAVVVGCSRDAGPPPETDAFLGYLQFAQALATELHNLKSAAEYQAKRDAFIRDCTELEKFQAKFQTLPRQTVETLVGEHAELVRKTKEACEKLARRHANMPTILGADWKRLEQALRDGHAVPAN